MNFPFWYFSVEDVSEFLMKLTTDIILAQSSVWFSIKCLRNAESDVCYWSRDM